MVEMIFYFDKQLLSATFILRPGLPAFVHFQKEEDATDFVKFYSELQPGFPNIAVEPHRYQQSLPQQFLPPHPLPLAPILATAPPLRLGFYCPPAPALPLCPYLPLAPAPALAPALAPVPAPAPDGYFGRRLEHKPNLLEPNLPVNYKVPTANHITQLEAEVA